MTTFKSKEFKALQEEWYTKLKESGFEDAEVEYKGELHLRISSVAHIRLHENPIEAIDAKIEYFTLLANKVDAHSFTSELERKILTEYAAGIKQIDIRKRLLKTGVSLHRVTIWKIIKKNLQRMKDGR